MPVFRLTRGFGLPRMFLALAMSLAALLTSPHQAAAQGGDAGAVPVTVAEVTARDLPIDLGNIGAVQANQNVLIRTRVDGTLDKLFFTEGQEVKQGDPIARIDPRPYQAVLAQARAKLAASQAQLKNAQLNLNRSTQLARNSYATQQTVDAQVAAVAQLEAQIKADAAAVDAAQLNLDYTLITAPFDGRLGLRQMDPGSVVRFADNSGVGIVTLSQIHPVAVVFSLPQDTLPAIQAAMSNSKLAVTAFAPDGQTMLGQGTLLTVDNAIDPASGTIRLKARFPNPDNKLWPGQFVNVSLRLGTRKDVLAVPSVGVQHGPDRLFVYVVKPDNTVAVQPVQVSHDDGHTAVISKGLQPGSRIVVNGQSRLRNGTLVKVNQTRPAS